MEFVFFVISICACVIGAITGIGGGILMKPLLDALQLLPISSISFMSGTTVLAMSVVSVIKNKRAGIKVGGRQTTYLAVGAAIGGVLGKLLFDLFRTEFGNDAVVGCAQAIILLLLTAMVFVYMLFKERIKTKKVQNGIVSCTTGIMMGLLASFLGIGGGPINLVILYYIFSMDTKTAAANSLYVIFFSQLASFLFALISGSIPQIPPVSLALMILGGISGGFVGSAILKRLNNGKIQTVFMCLLVVIMGLCVYNAVIGL